MPVISMTMGPVPAETKKELIANLTETAAKCTSIGKEHFIVLIHELDQGNIGLGGVDLKTRQKAD